MKFVHNSQVGIYPGGIRRQENLQDLIETHFCKYQFTKLAVTQTHYKTKGYALRNLHIATEVLHLQHWIHMSTSIANTQIKNDSDCYTDRKCYSIPKMSIIYTSIPCIPAHSGNNNLSFIRMLSITRWTNVVLSASQNITRAFLNYGILASLKYAQSYVLSSLTCFNGVQSRPWKWSYLSECLLYIDFRLIRMLVDS